ncbi:hypothetical protein [Variovorax soli]|uniref:hypothetical protein n=1 Tax=Variovorax soli TaxID=376815 RepID=UPI000839AA4F|nr:hypothetical protein [Variovorax soli]
MASTDTTGRSDSQRRRPGRMERLVTPRPLLHPSRILEASKRFSDITVAKGITKAVSGATKGPR